MRTKIHLLIMVGLMMAFITSCTNPNTATFIKIKALQNHSMAPNPTVELVFMNYLEEYTDQVKMLTELYQKEHPNIKIKSVILGSDYENVLQTRIATGDTPDIFLSGPYSGVERYAPASVELSEQGFWSSLDPSYNVAVTVDGQRTAAPIIVQAYGIIYNKDVFQQAGITKIPGTLSELKAAAEKIKTAGIQPFSEGFKDRWVFEQLSEFPLGSYPDFSGRIQSWMDGRGSFKQDPISDKIFNLLTIVRDYAQPHAFDTDFYTQATQVAQGQAAMMTQGDWAVASALKANPDAQMGIMPLPLSEDPSDARIYATASMTIHVSKDSKHKKDALDFVNWLLTSDPAKRWFADDLKVMSPVKGVHPANSKVLEQANRFISQGYVGDWGNYGLPPGLSEQIQPIIQKYLMHQLSKSEAIQLYSDAIAHYR